jgi:hypothetical protein
VADEEPSDDILAASHGVVAEGARVKAWKTARDARHVVVEVDLGWRRRVVFAVRHGLRKAETGQSHSLLGSRGVAIDA